MHLRLMALVIASAMVLTACGDDVIKGLVSEKYDPRTGYNVSRSDGKCKTTEWLLIIDQGPRVAKSKRLAYVCVTEEVADRYSLLATYP